MFEEKENLCPSLSMHPLTFTIVVINFPHSGSKSTFGKYHKKHKKAHKEVEVFRGPSSHGLQTTQDPLCNLGIIFFCVLSPFYLFLSLRLMRELKLDINKGRFISML